MKVLNYLFILLSTSNGISQGVPENDTTKLKDLISIEKHSVFHDLNGSQDTIFLSEFFYENGQLLRKEVADIIGNPDNKCITHYFYDDNWSLIDSSSNGCSESSQMLYEVQEGLDSCIISENIFWKDFNSEFQYSKMDVLNKCNGYFHSILKIFSNSKQLLRTETSMVNISGESIIQLSTIFYYNDLGFLVKEDFFSNQILYQENVYVHKFID